MPRYLTILAGTLALAVLSTGSLAAQDTTVRKESKGDVVAAPTYESMLAAINASSTATTKISGLTELKAEQIRLVDAATLVTEANKEQFKKALDMNEKAIHALRDALKKNELVTKSLTEHPAKLELDDVVAADVMDGNLVLFYRKD
jgi:hypothetical protein